MSEFDNRDDQDREDQQPPEGDDPFGGQDPFLPDPDGRRRRGLLYMLLIAAFVAFFVWSSNGQLGPNAEGNGEVEQLATSEFVTAVKEKRVSEVTYKATYAKAPKLGRPRIYSVFASAKSSATAVWTAVSNARSYELQWRVGRGSWHSFAVKGKSKAIKGLKSGKLYQFRVRAVASSVKGAWSNVSGRYYQTVSLKSIKRVGAGAVSAVWRADPKANAGYAVIVRDKFGGKVLARKVVSAGVTSATVRGLAPGKRVWVRVRSLRTEGVLTYVGVLSAGRYVRL